MGLRGKGKMVRVVSDPEPVEQPKVSSADEAREKVVPECAPQRDKVVA